MWRVLSEDVHTNWAGSNVTYYEDVMSANGAFVSTVTAGFSTGNFYTTGIVKIDNDYYLGLAANGEKYFINGTNRYRFIYDLDDDDWSYILDMPVGTPFDKVPADVMTYLANKDFTLTVE